MSAITKLLHDLQEIEQEAHRLILLISGELNEIEKTVSRLRNELKEMNEKQT